MLMAAKEQNPIHAMATWKPRKTQPIHATILLWAQECSESMDSQQLGHRCRKGFANEETVVDAVAAGFSVGAAFSKRSRCRLPGKQEKMQGNETLGSLGRFVAQSYPKGPKHFLAPPYT
jgi:hypothetical protein